MTPEQRHLWRAIRRAIRATDGLFRRLALALRGILAPYRDRTRLTHTDRRAILRALDAVLAPVFGLTRQAAQGAALTRLIVDMSADTSEGVVRRAYDRLARLIERRDPALWQRVRLTSLTVPAERGLPSVVAMFEGPPVQAERLRRAKFVDPARRWVDPRGYRLSDRVWRSGRDVRRAIDGRIRLAITRGDDPIRVARELERYLNPAWQPLRYEPDGRIVVDPTRKQVYTMLPRGGHGSNAARRLARTEIIGAHGRATIASALEIPGVLGVAWNLSAQHPEPDECDDKARGHSRGLPRGTYTPHEVPSFPTHPQDLCYLTHYHMPPDDVVDLIVKQYGGV